MAGLVDPLDEVLALGPLLIECLFLLLGPRIKLLLIEQPLLCQLLFQLLSLLFLLFFEIVRIGNYESIPNTELVLSLFRGAFKLGTYNC